MKETLTFEFVCFDSLRLGPEVAGTSHQFFGEAPSGTLAPSVTQDPESAICAQLFEGPPPWQPHVRDLIVRHLALPVSAKHKLSVRAPVVHRPNNKPGDVDVLLCDPPSTHLAVAVECKRVKVRAISQDADTVNKIDAISGGVAQANGLREMGFHRTYLALLIVTDGRMRMENNTLARGPTGHTLRRIYDFPGRGDLHKHVGIILIEIVQPTGKRIGEMAGVGVHVLAPAVLQDQPVDLSRRIAELFRAH